MRDNTWSHLEENNNNKLVLELFTECMSLRVFYVCFYSYSYRNYLRVRTVIAMAI